jgi:hypothetical protein
LACSESGQFQVLVKEEMELKENVASRLELGKSALLVPTRGPDSGARPFMQHVMHRFLNLAKRNLRVTLADLQFATNRYNSMPVKPILKGMRIYSHAKMPWCNNELARRVHGGFSKVGFMNTQLTPAPF